MQRAHLAAWLVSAALLSLVPLASLSGCASEDDHGPHAAACSDPMCGRGVGEESPNTSGTTPSGAPTDDNGSQGGTNGSDAGFTLDAGSSGSLLSGLEAGTTPVTPGGDTSNPAGGGPSTTPVTP